MALHDVIQPHIATIEHDGKRLDVSCRIAFDGIEYVGRLWFSDAAGGVRLMDRGAIPGRSSDDVLALARRLTPPELALRYRRALAERRRFFELRRVTEEILTRIRYMNQISVSMRAGLLDAEGAAQELEITEQQMHELVDQLRLASGIERSEEE